MPALVVWERLHIAGDDLRCISILTLVLRLWQICMVIYVVYSIMKFEHEPKLYVASGCLANEEAYWIWYSASLLGLVFTLLFAIFGAVIEVTMFRISGRGTPTETDARLVLSSLCKCNMVPMFICRMVGFTFIVIAIALTEKICICVNDHISEAVDDVSEALFEQELGEFSTCPTNIRSWYIVVKWMAFTMACDVLFPMIALLVILRYKIYRCYRQIRPMKENTLEEVERSWQLTCKRCCECSSLMTCYMFGGQKLTAGSYADVAIALADFLGDGGSLDIVPSDIAAALICLVNVQKQKQIDCKNALLAEGGVFAKDEMLATRLWSQIVTPITTPKGKVKLTHISTSLRNSLSLEMSSSNSIRDLETGEKDEGDSFPQRGEEKEEADEKVIPYTHQSTSSSQSLPTDTQLEELRKMILSRKDTMERIDFNLIHKDSSMTYEPTVATILSPQNSFDCLVLGEGSRYCAVALAAYSWMMYLVANKCGCCKLTGHSIYHACTCDARCSCCYSNDNIIGADWSGWKQATVLKSLGIEESDLLFANFSNDVGVNPYLIIRDREWKTIVITIRGTLSFEDMISDVTMSPISLEDSGIQFGFDGKGEFCHSGMLAGAKWIYDDMKGKLDETMCAHPDFGIRIVGHSLGAGVAAMLGLMLRQQYPSLYCLCFSPPGCVFSERTARESKCYVCSFVLHNDMVPRLSFDSLANLRNDLIEMIARIKVPKHKVFDANLKPWNEESLRDIPEKMLHNKDDIPSSKFYTDFEKFKEKQTERKEERARQNISMTLPGRILHMVRTSTQLNSVPCSCVGGCVLSCAKCLGCGFINETKKYKVRWTNAEDISGLVISNTMMVDHFPYNVARALDAAADSYGVTGHTSDTCDRDQMTKILLEGAEKEEPTSANEQAAKFEISIKGAKKDS